MFTSYLLPFRWFILLTLTSPELTNLVIHFLNVPFQALFKSSIVWTLQAFKYLHSSIGMSFNNMLPQMAYIREIMATVLTDKFSNFIMDNFNMSLQGDFL